MRFSWYFIIFLSLKSFGNSWDNSYIPCLLLIITLHFHHERKICQICRLECQNWTIKSRWILTSIVISSEKLFTSSQLLISFICLSYLFKIFLKYAHVYCRATWGIFSPSSKNKKTHSKIKFFPVLKNSYIFSKIFFLYFRRELSKSEKQNFLYFGEWNFLAPNFKKNIL